MSLDEQYEQMRFFAQALDEFNERLNGSVQDLTRRHEAVHPLWQDSFRKHYDAEWDEFKQHMDAYLRHEGPSYAQFLDEKIRSLQAYLFGHYG